TDDNCYQPVGCVSVSVTHQSQLETQQPTPQSVSIGDRFSWLFVGFPWVYSWVSLRQTNRR
ncbi:MAG: hypothetical protein ACKN87_12160, partial [Microcystis aeruginosa]